MKLQIDIGFGDAITPSPQMVVYPSLLGFPAPELRAYPKESVVAEKVDAMVQLGIANSRMKDFYDLVELSERFNFDGTLLVRAIVATFERRKTPLPKALPVALTDEFSSDASKKTQWSAFVRKSGVHTAPTFQDAMESVANFISRPLMSASKGESLGSHWPAGGPWQE